jgi:lipopolysaccharide/colanic/teichoic acid biosynthesis glycosyltransferase
MAPLYPPRHSRIAPAPPRLGPALRRAVDIGVVALVAPLVLAVIGLLAIAIKLDTPGPIFIAHKRVGRGGRSFRLMKLRTMVRDAEELKQQLAHLNVLPWPDFKIPDDPRITRVGGWLRKLSLDELPQLWNVLCGHMTLVGPRPCSVGIEKYAPWQTERLEAIPGVMGLWQTEGRNHADFPARCRMDIAQVRADSPASALALAARTIRAVVTSRENY